MLSDVTDGRWPSVTDFGFDFMVLYDVRLHLLTHKRGVPADTFLLAAKPAASSKRVARSAPMRHMRRRVVKRRSSAFIPWAGRLYATLSLPAHSARIDHSTRCKRGLEPNQIPIDDIPTLADAYLQAIRTVQPQGPYLLGDWSLGGTIAFEMARQLLAQGEQLDLLALIDSSLTSVNDTAGDKLDTFGLLADFIDDLSRLLDKTLRIDVAELHQPVPAVREAYILAHAREQGIVPPDVRYDQVRRLARVFQANMQAFQQYQPEPAPVHVELIQASASIEPASDIRDAWRRFALRGVGVHDVHIVPGDHYTLLQISQVRAVAAWLRERLEEPACHTR